MQIFNTLTRQKEEFVPQVPGEYRIYVCGPTVYNYIHIGNARPLIVFDTLRRYLEYRGNKVIYVSNITDIDDKLIKKGQEEGTSMKEVAQRFEAEYLKDAAGLNCKKPTVQPRATEHIQQILDIVKDLIDSGHAYVAKNGDVYFRVKSDPEYGKLSHLKLDDLESGNRELRSQMEDDLKEDTSPLYFSDALYNILVLHIFSVSFACFRKSRTTCFTFLLLFAFTAVSANPRSAKYRRPGSKLLIASSAAAFNILSAAV